MSGPVRGALLAVCLFAAVWVGTTAAQESRPNPLAPGAWALEFGIGQNFTLTSFNGATIAVKKLHSERTAFRAGLTVSLSTNDQSSSTSDTLGYQSQTDRDGYGLSFGLDWLRYLRPDSKWSFYTGLGPAVNLNHSKETSYSQRSNFDAGTSSSQSGWGAGINGFFGAEWFVSRTIGVHAEYLLSAGYGSSTTETERFASYPNTVIHNTDKRESHGWSVSSGFVRFGLSAYF